jgi:hypothetical protein
MSACPPNDGCLSGNCEFCGQKGDCVLLAILRKVSNLESIIEKMAGQTA